MKFGVKIINGLLWGQIGMSTRTLICFFISIIIARSLGAANYGIYAALVSLITLLCRFTEMGIQSIFGTYIPRFKSKGQSGEYSFVVQKVIITRIVIILISAGSVYLFQDIFVSFLGVPAISDYIVLASVWFVIRAVTDCFIFIIWAKVDMKLYTAAEIIISVVQLIGICILMNMGITVDNIVMLMILVNSVQLICYYRGSVSTIKPKPVRTKLTPIIKFGLVIWLSTILQYFINRSIDIFMILYYLKEPSSAAFYDIAYLIVFTGGTCLLLSIGSLSVPILSESHARYGMEGLKRAWKFLTKVSMYLSVPVFAFIFVHANSIIQNLYTNVYSESTQFVMIFSILLLTGHLFASETSAMILFPLNKERLFLYLRGFNGLLNLGLNILLIPRYGIMGAVIATGGAFLITSIMELGLALKILKTRLPYSFMLKLALSIGVSISWTLFLKDMGTFLMVCVAFLYGIMVTWLMSWLYRFSKREKEIIQEINPGVYRMLTRLNLLKYAES